MASVAASECDPFHNRLGKLRLRLAGSDCERVFATTGSEQKRR
jgi:hypothetical protein